MNKVDETQVALFQFLLLMKMRKKWKLRNLKKRRRYKTRPIYRSRKINGFYSATFVAMKLQDKEQFFKYTRMSVPVFDELLGILKKDLNSRQLPDSVGAEEKLAMTLHFLSEGGSMQSIAWAYKMGLTSVHKYIHEVTTLLWDKLSPVFLKPPTKEQWKSIANKFFEKCNFPNCVGALDGAYGSASDGGVLQHSDFGKKMDKNQLNPQVPEDSMLPGTNINMPYVFVADEAFPLKTFLMRPFPGKQLTQMKKVYNYRLSRARRTIENAFGILVARWRILKGTICAKDTNLDNIIKAVVVLHNFCIIKTQLEKGYSLYCPRGYSDVGDSCNGGWRTEISQPLSSVGRLGANNSQRIASNVREALANYFISESGSVPWQLDRIY